MSKIGFLICAVAALACVEARAVAVSYAGYIEITPTRGDLRLVVRVKDDPNSVGDVIQPTSDGLYVYRPATADFGDSAYLTR